MKKFLFSFLLLLSLCFSSCFYFDKTAYEDNILKQQIAQMIIVGFNGTTITKTNPIYHDIVNNRISGIVLFSKDLNKAANKSSDTIKNITSPQQLKKLIDELNALSKTKLFIAIDQEGGKISRLPKSMGFNVETLSHQKLGKADDVNLTYNQAELIASNLKTYGINLNFAPCLDLALNKKSTVIYKQERSFSDNENIVAKHAAEFIKAHRKHNILTVCKHFPGHGSSLNDSHEGFTDITKTWTGKEFIPYKILNDEGLLDGVMVAHVYNKDFDEYIPASLSKYFITAILKNQFGFEGLIFSDDLQMKAISNNYSLQEAIIRAINAGTDVLVFANNLTYDKDIAKKFNNIVFKAVKSGKISKKRIKYSYDKIIKAKQSLN